MDKRLKQIVQPEISNLKRKLDNKCDIILSTPIKNPSLSDSIFEAYTETPAMFGQLTRSIVTILGQFHEQLPVIILREFRGIEVKEQYQIDPSTPNIDFFYVVNHIGHAYQMKGGGKANKRTQIEVLKEMLVCEQKGIIPHLGIWGYARGEKPPPPFPKKKFKKWLELPEVFWERMTLDPNFYNDLQNLIKKALPRGKQL